MTARVLKAATIDGLGISFSSLCLVHCLLLPILSAGLPFLGVWAEMEWIHKAFVVAAFPFAVLTLTSSRATRLTRGLIIAGILLLAGAAFAEPLHDFETLLTVLGGGMLALGHGLSWRRAHASGQS